MFSPPRGDAALPLFLPPFGGEMPQAEGELRLRSPPPPPPNRRRTFCPALGSRALAVPAQHSPNPLADTIDNLRANLPRSPHRSSSPPRSRRPFGRPHARGWEGGAHGPSAAAAHARATAPAARRQRSLTTPPPHLGDHRPTLLSTTRASSAPPRSAPASCYSSPPPPPSTTTSCKRPTLKMGR